MTKEVATLPQLAALIHGGFDIARCDFRFTIGDPDVGGAYHVELELDLNQLLRTATNAALNKTGRARRGPVSARLKREVTK